MPTLDEELRLPAHSPDVADRLAVARAEAEVEKWRLAKLKRLLQEGTLVERHAAEALVLEQAKTLRQWAEALPAQITTRLGLPTTQLDALRNVIDHTWPL